MYRNIRFLGAALAVAACLLCSAVAKADHKPGHNPGGGNGGGGNDPPPAGIIYYYHDGSVWTMQADGSEQTRLPLSVGGFGSQPSYDLHADERWFTTQVDSNEPQFPNGRWSSEIRAVSEAGFSVPLLAETDVEVLTPAIWLPDDSSMSFIGERWALDEYGQPTTVTEAGLFQFDIDYGGDGNIIGAVPGSLTFVKDLSSELLIDADGFNYDSEVAGHSWSPTTRALTFGVRHWDRVADWDQEEIWVMDLDQPEDSYLLSTDIGAGWPEWSPDGTKIGYGMIDGTVIYDLERNRSKRLGRTPVTAWGISHWSPDGSQFVISHWDNLKPGYDGIYRLNANLGGKTLLVDDNTMCSPTEYCVLITLGWRDVLAMASASVASIPEPETAITLLVGLSTFFGWSHRRWA